MRTKQHPPLRTLGSRAAHLVAALHARRRSLYTLADVTDITGLGDSSARSLARRLVDRGIATRLRSGLFILIPFELGLEREYLGNPFLVARMMAGARPYYLSHASAMSIHGMLTQPQLVVYATSPAPVRGRTILGTEFRFVRCKRSHLFGTTEHWADKQERVVVSDLERTVLDGLKQPEYCGGLTEAAKGLWIRRADVSASKIVDYALRLGVGAVIRRLGYLLEAYRIGSVDEIERLRASLTPTYDLLDPLLPREGRFLARWRLRLNVSPEEVQAVTRT